MLCWKKIYYSKVSAKLPVRHSKHCVCLREAVPSMHKLCQSFHWKLLPASTSPLHSHPIHGEGLTTHLALTPSADSSGLDGAVEGWGGIIWLHRKSMEQNTAFPLPPASSLQVQIPNLPQWSSLVVLCYHYFSLWPTWHGCSEDKVGRRKPCTVCFPVFLRRKANMRK